MVQQRQVAHSRGVQPTQPARLGTTAGMPDNVKVGRHATMPRWYGYCQCKYNTRCHTADLHLTVPALTGCDARHSMRKRSTASAPAARARANGTHLLCPRPRPRPRQPRAAEGGRRRPGRRRRPASPARAPRRHPAWEGRRRRHLLHLQARPHGAALRRRAVRGAQEPRRHAQRAQLGARLPRPLAQPAPAPRAGNGSAAAAGRRPCRRTPPGRPQRREPCRAHRQRVCLAGRALRKPPHVSHVQERPGQAAGGPVAIRPSPRTGRLEQWSGRPAARRQRAGCGSARAPAKPSGAHSPRSHAALRGPRRIWQASRTANSRLCAQPPGAPAPAPGRARTGSGVGRRAAPAPAAACSPHPGALNSAATRAGRPRRGSPAALRPRGSGAAAVAAAAPPRRAARSQPTRGGATGPASRAASCPAPPR